LQVPCDLIRFWLRCGNSRARRLPLSQFRHISAAQHQVEVGMSDEAAHRIDDVCLAMLAHLDLRDDVPDEFEIYLSDADAGVTTVAGRCEGYVRFGFGTKIDRTVIGFVGHGLDEFRVLFKVVVAVDHVRLQAGDSESLDARGINLREFRDRRDLAQQTHGVDSTLRQCCPNPGQLRGPSELSLDLPYELTDLARRRLGLLALNAEEGTLVLLIKKRDLEQTIGDQGDTDHRNEQRNVFRE